MATEIDGYGNRDRVSGPVVFMTCAETPDMVAAHEEYRAEHQAQVDRSWSWAPRWLPSLFGIKVTPRTDRARQRFPAAF